MTFRLTNTIRGFRAFLFYWISPPQNVTTDTIQYTKGLGYRFIELIRAHRENTVLKESLENYSFLDAQLEDFKSENQRLKQLLSLKETNSYETIPAVVSGRDPQSWTSSFWIGKGTDDAIEVDDPVVSVQNVTDDSVLIQHGVIGRIWEAGVTSSKILLISDPLSSIAVTLPRTGEQGLVRGGKSFKVYVDYLDAEARLQIGDKIVTSGLGGIFPAGLPIGTVTSITDAPSGFKRAGLKPYIAVNKIREILILKLKK